MKGQQFRILHNEELRDLHRSPSGPTAKIIKPRRLRWAVHGEDKDGWDKECIQDFGEETSYKTVIC
jgi:hypothetical protein